MEFKAFPKVPRYSRNVVITEKIDGTNASVFIKSLEAWDTAIQEQKDGWLKLGDSLIRAGSRNRFITPEKDNFGFAQWVHENADELVHLGPGTHYGEWWGQGIQRGYGLDEKRFSLFNVNRWVDVHDGFHCKDVGYTFTNGAVVAPECCHVVPLLGVCGMDESESIHAMMAYLKESGSRAAPGFMHPEGIMIYHSKANVLFKKTFENDETGKWEK